MAKLILLTGKLAEPEVREAAGRLDVEVLIVPVSIAQFISPGMAADALKGRLGKGKGPTMTVLLPGLARFDAGEVEKLLQLPGVRCFKGPSHASDIVEVVQTGIKLSKSEPADRLLLKRGLEDYQEAAVKAEKGAVGPGINIGPLRIGPRLPPKIIAEIVDAPLMTDAQILARAKYYLKSGADIIDVGAIAAEDNSRRLGDIVRMLKREIKAPVSIDSLSPREINSALGAGADLVLSLDSRNMADVDMKTAAYVVIPDDGADDPVASLVDNLKKAEKLGFRNLIADPILAPPFRTAGSLAQYLEVAKTAPASPLMMGVANAVELMDADSPGMNALLASFAAELGVSLLLTTENSEKARGSVRELKRATEMCFLARSKKSLPKDLGFDLLVAKGKGRGPVFNLAANAAGGGHPKPINAAEDRSFDADPKGYFSIFIDADRGKIIAAHSKKPDDYDFVFEGEDAESVSKKILGSGLVSTQQHAAYLGRELQKAETCLRAGKGYFQDENLPG